MFDTHWVARRGDTLGGRPEVIGLDELDEATLCVKLLS